MEGGGDTGERETCSTWFGWDGMFPEGWVSLSCSGEMLRPSLRSSPRSLQKRLMAASINFNLCVLPVLAVNSHRID